jgi:hypothetical protein
MLDKKLFPVGIPTTFVVALNKKKEEDVALILHTHAQNNPHVLVVDVHKALTPDLRSASSVEKVIGIMLQDVKHKKQLVPGSALVRVLDCFLASILSQTVDMCAKIHRTKKKKIERLIVVGTPHTPEQAEALHGFYPRASIVCINGNHGNEPQTMEYHKSIIAAVATLRRLKDNSFTPIAKTVTAKACAESILRLALADSSH